MEESSGTNHPWNIGSISSSEGWVDIFLRGCNKKHICKKKTSEIFETLKEHGGISAVLFLMRLWSSHSDVQTHARLTRITIHVCETLSDFLLNAGWKKGNLCVLVHQYMHLEISDSSVTYKANATWIGARCSAIFTTTRVCKEWIPGFERDTWNTKKSKTRMKIQKVFVNLAS